MLIPAHSGVEEMLWPCSGSQIPCSQMISMNISPPLASAASSVATLPAVNARIPNSCRRNIGALTRYSIPSGHARHRGSRPDRHMALADRDLDVLEVNDRELRAELLRI